ncbi:MAG: UvrD-helicase domain-containing protein [Candidatus Eisenbacteria bacterium]
MASSPFDAMRDQRDRATGRIIGSPARRKLIVAGPGTGKTFTFRSALEVAEGRGLALTFIRNLVRDLSVALDGLAQVFTFHGYCNHLMHRLSPAGISRSVDFYAPLLSLIAEDLKFGEHPRLRDEDLERHFQDLDGSDNVLAHALSSGNYYDAVSFIDVVYRVLRHLQADPSSIPTYALVVVDEYQDFSRLETAFIAQLAERSPVLIAGDDDQALYAFKHASASYIRELAAHPDYERFPLPFCSRCTQVLVDAVNSVIETAQRAGHLQGRLEREFRCFLPDKQAGSEAHPQIIHAHSSVEQSRAPYVGRYVAQQIHEIPEADLQEARERHEPAALITGPKHFVERVHGFLVGNGFPDAELRRSTRSEPTRLDGYRRIAVDGTSRLGWRVLLHLDPPDDSAGCVRRALRTNEDLVSLIPGSYRDRHAGVAGLVLRVIGDGRLSAGDQATLEDAVGLSISEISGALRAPSGQEEEQEGDHPETPPPIICTSLLGAKGLAAQHVFVVGANNGDFPRNPERITDEEICCLVVALSRARKACHFISCGRFAGLERQTSVFLDWIRPFTLRRDVNRRYWESR